MNSNWIILRAKNNWILASAGMTALNSVMPAQAGIHQVLFEKVAHDLEREQMAKILDRLDGKATEL